LYLCHVAISKGAVWYVAQTFTVVDVLERTARDSQVTEMIGSSD